jgi:uncharacterized protein (TIGR02391 family)
MTKKSKTKKLARRVRTRHLSAPIIQNLSALSGQIGKIIPGTSQGSFCFEKIAKKLGYKAYWPKDGNRDSRIFEFLKKIYQRHPKTFYKIFRENLPAGITRRQKNGDPVLKAEMDAVSATLLKLNVNLKKEIGALNLPVTRPTIVPPPPEFKSMVEKIGLHPILQPDCVKKFTDGHINDAVRKALEKYEVYVQGKSGLKDKIGKDLMAHAFDENGPQIMITDTSTVRGHSLQEGFKFISMGAMEFWRNFLSHGDEAQIPHQDAIAILATVSHLLYQIDGYESKSATPKTSMTQDGDK